MNEEVSQTWDGSAIVYDVKRRLVFTSREAESPERRVVRDQPDIGRMFASSEIVYVREHFTELRNVGYN